MKQPLLNNDNICKEINLKGPLKNIFKIIRENENTSVQKSCFLNLHQGNQNQQQH